MPQATILPRWMMAIRSHISSATSSVCVLISTVPPRCANSRKMSFSSRALLGSRPTIGSSTTITSGRWISALEMISFCRMPWLYDSVSSSFQRRELEQLEQLVDPPLDDRALLPVQRRDEPQELGAGELVVDERAGRE